jgi:hypothetical protein
MPLNHAMRGSSTAISRSKNFNPPHAAQRWRRNERASSLANEGNHRDPKKAEFKGNKFSAASMLLFGPN